MYGVPKIPRALPMAQIIQAHPINQTLLARGELLNMLLPPLSRQYRAKYAQTPGSLAFDFQNGVLPKNTNQWRQLISSLVKEKELNALSWMVLHKYKDVKRRIDAPLNVDMCYCKLNIEDLETLALWVKHLPDFIALDLSNNEIDADGARTLAKMLETNSKLTVLALRNNKLGDEGAAILADALRCNETLTALALNANGIGLKGIESLGYMFRRNTGLTKLALNGNSLHNAGVGELLPSSNTTLTNLHLSNCGLNDTDADALIDAFGKNMALTNLFLSNLPNKDIDSIKLLNNIGGEKRNKINGCLTRNRGIWFENQPNHQFHANLRHIDPNVLHAKL